MIRYFVLLSALTLAACQSTPPMSEDPESSLALADDQPLPVGAEELSAPSDSLYCEYETYADPQFDLPEPIDLWQRMRMGFALPEEHHPRIDNYLSWYQKHPSYLDRVTERGALYLPYIVARLEQADLPLELALLPIVESAFDPFAYSHGRAAGMWQFVPGTAKAYGLKLNWWYDGRRDIVASTDAAIAYLTYLRNYFDGDWLAALAAYNSGEGTVGRARKKNRKAGKSDDYWSLKLPKETAAYVPQLLALAKIVGNPSDFNIALQPLSTEQRFQQVPIGSQIDLSQAAKLADIPIEELYRLNPGFNRWATDPTGPHQLLIPTENTPTFVKNLSQLSPEQRVGWERYTIQPGDALISIAKRFNTEVDTLKLVNNLRGNTIRAGKTLMIPVALEPGQHYSLSANQRLANAQERKENTSNSQKVMYTTQPGDSFWLIAKKFNVGVRELAKWNGLAPTDPLAINKTLVIWQDDGVQVASAPNTKPLVRKIHYKVRSGDSLARIAQKFNITVAQIRNWNTSARKKYLHPGDSLTLFVDVRNSH